MTHGSYDDNGDHLMNYVKNGGGLVLGGHAWKWAEQSVNREKCYMLEYPGNKIISRVGIVFSSEKVPENDAVFRIDTVPALKYSLYYALKAFIFGPSAFHPQDARPNLFNPLPISNNTLGDIQLFSKQLGTNEFFRIILSYLTSYRRYVIDAKYVCDCSKEVCDCNCLLRHVTEID
jgi:hypothetical protein